MKRQFDSKTTITWMGMGMGFVLILLGVLVGGMLLAPSVVDTSSTVQPTLTFTAPPPLPTPTDSVVILEPSPTFPMPTPTPAPTVVTDGSTIVTYVVKDGDTLSGIALEYDITVEAIRAANPDLTSEIIFPGDVLTISSSAIAVSVTPPPLVTGENITHTVALNETLWDIAVYYQVDVEVIKSANQLTSDTIQPGDVLLIPLGEYTVQPPASETIIQTWHPSIIEGDLDTAYPLTIDTERFTLNYPPNSLPAQDTDRVLEMIGTALTHIEGTLDVHLEGRFNTYAAGSLFASPNLALRGRSFSSQRRFFFLYDGSGSPADQQYILTHELTHVTTWNTMGAPASVMLHEGVAVYTGMKLVENTGYIPLDLFCAAYYTIEQLPSLSASPSFEGHIRDLSTYYAAGCFVKFLIEKYGTDNFATVYRTGDYGSVYGKSLVELEAEWIGTIQAVDSFPFDPNELEHFVSELATAYDLLFSNFEGTERDMAAYQKLDQARMALLQGQLNDTADYLLVFRNILNQ